MEAILPWMDSWAGFKSSELARYFWGIEPYDFRRRWRAHVRCIGPLVFYVSLIALFGPFHDSWRLNVYPIGGGGAGGWRYSGLSLPQLVAAAGFLTSLVVVALGTFRIPRPRISQANVDEYRLANLPLFSIFLARASPSVEGTLLFVGVHGLALTALTGWYIIASELFPISWPTVEASSQDIIVPLVWTGATGLPLLGSAIAGATARTEQVGTIRAISVFATNVLLSPLLIYLALLNFGLVGIFMASLKTRGYPTPPYYVHFPLLNYVICAEILSLYFRGRMIYRFWLRPLKLAR